MGKRLYKVLQGTCPYVTLFGIIVMVSLIFQCFIPFLQRVAASQHGRYEWLLGLVNLNFQLPMEMISNFWAAISAAYVGLDRAAFTVDAMKNGIQNHAFDEDKMISLTHVMILSFIIYITAVGLNTFFDAELALTPLFVSFGSSVLCYVAGNKSVVAFSKLTPEQEKQMKTNDERLDLIDDLTNDQFKSIELIIKKMKSKEDAIIRIRGSKVLFVK